MAEEPALVPLTVRDGRGMSGHKSGCSYYSPDCSPPKEGVAASCGRDFRTGFSLFVHVAHARISEAAVADLIQAARRTAADACGAQHAFGVGAHEQAITPCPACGWTYNHWTRARLPATSVSKVRGSIPHGRGLFEFPISGPAASHPSGYLQGRNYPRGRRTHRHAIADGS